MIFRIRNPYNESLFYYFRTARGDNQGTALSFVNIQEMKYLEQVEESLADSTRMYMYIECFTVTLTICVKYEL
jgi:hypothetical protein